MMAEPTARRARARSAHHRHPAGAVRREAIEGRQVPRAVVGRPGSGALIELRAGDAAGAAGCPARSACSCARRLYPLVLGSVGRNVVFGVNVTLRHPHKIHIGDNVVIDDLCCLDAKGTDNKGITIGNGVFVGRNTILSCKNGDIIIDDRANIGFNCEIFSASRVRVGKNILMAAYTYLVGGDHLYDRVDIPVLQQGRTARGHRRRRRRLARHARRGHRWIDASAAMRSSAPARSSSARSRSLRSRPVFRRR